jgi:hypothetical protein
MKSYVVKIVEWPDVGGIQAMASKSSTGRYPEKGGDYRSYTRNILNKNKVRRYWKRKSRKESKQLCVEE